MSEQVADVLEILIGQMAENREMNAVLDEELGVLPQPEFLQSLCDRLHLPQSCRSPTGPQTAS
jgi:hypothetical protein